MSEVNRIANEVYRSFANDNRSHVEANPVCEVCGENPSVQITQFGPIKAACEGCLESERKAFEEYQRSEMERDDVE